MKYTEHYGDVLKKPGRIKGKTKRKKQGYYSLKPDNPHNALIIMRRYEP